MANPILELVKPLWLLALSGFFGVLTLFSLVLSFQISPLFSLSSFKHHWFARFWRFYGPISHETGAATVAPLLNSARGVVLDVGPGGGHWLHLYNRDKVTKIYGVEPNHEHHPALLRRAKEAGLQGVFELVPAYVEDVQKDFGIQRGSIDTVVTCQVLCSIDDAGPLISELYKLLKPGGQWLVYEHVRTGYRGPIAWYQGISLTPLSILLSQSHC